MDMDIDIDIDIDMDMDIDIDININENIWKLMTTYGEKQLKQHTHKYDKIQKIRIKLKHK